MISPTKSRSVGRRSADWAENFTRIFWATVDSALSGRNEALSFSCTVEILENAEPENPPIANQEIMTRTATQSALRPFALFVPIFVVDDVELTA